MVLQYSMISAILGFLLGQLGMASALDTSCGQSYGAKQHRRSMLVLMIVSIPLASVWASTKSILIFLCQNPEISAEAGKYVQLMVPSLLAYGLLQCQNRFIQTQNIVFPMELSSGVTTFLHLLVCWIMVFKSGLGSRGAALANSDLLNFCIQIISIMFVGHLRELPLAGASMATSFLSVTGVSLLLGMACALDTLCGQSYGAMQYRMSAKKAADRVYDSITPDNTVS
ncbi:hypothetical protein RJT34_04877 [Clitoria ternatea]|uniref:Uncharacterized protein n=1 Tax=Clitoria ternatea TaxID=43366 RepID=A0AAN9KPX9_CLITE